MIISQREQIKNLEEYIERYDMNGKKSSNTYLGGFNLTFYSKEQFPNSNTSLGIKPQSGVTVAVDPNIIPLGSVIYIEGFGIRIAQDTGGAIKGKKLDVFVDTNAEAFQLGVKKNIKVWLIK